MVPLIGHGASDGSSLCYTKTAPGDADSLYLASMQKVTLPCLAIAVTPLAPRLEWSARGTTAACCLCLRHGMLWQVSVCQECFRNMHGHTTSMMGNTPSTDRLDSLRARCDGNSLVSASICCRCVSTLCALQHIYTTHTQSLVIRMSGFSMCVVVSSHCHG
jgi:hypothetical protein